MSITGTGLIPAGTALTFTVGVQTGALSGITDIEQGIAAELANQGLPVQGWASSGSLAQIGIPFTPATLTGNIFTTSTFPDDNFATIESIINGVVQDFTGSAPVSSAAVTSYTLPGGSQSSSGQAGASAPSTPGLITQIENFFSSLGNDTVTALIVIVAVLLIVLLIAGYAPNVKHIAGALP